MSFAVTFSGSREEARKSVTLQSDQNIANGVQSEEQKAVLLALIDTAVGAIVSGSVSGHNDLASNYMTVTFSSYTPAPQAQQSA